MTTATFGATDVPFSGQYDGSIVSILEQLRLTADLEGLAILDLSADAADNPVSYTQGLAGTETIALGGKLLSASPAQPSHTVAADKRHILACPWILPPARRGGLVMWRGAHDKPWTGVDHDLAASIAMLLRLALGASIGQVGIDLLTGVPNRRWFLDEADRHIERLELDGVVGTLFLLDIDGLGRVNNTLGRKQGDRILIRMVSQLRAMVRPGDLVARIGPDEFAVWQNGMDQFTAAERAETLTSRKLFQDLPDGAGVSFSIGIASRPTGSNEDIRTLLRRAHVAIREVKEKGGGGWRVAQAEKAQW